MTSGAVLSAAPVTRRRLRPWLFALLFWLLLAAFASLVLWQLRRSALDGQTRELRLLSLSLTDEIGRGLRGAEEGLRAMRVELQQGRLPFTGPDTASMLRTRADLMPLVRALWLVDRDGRLLAASEAMPAPELPSFAPALDRLPEGAAAISRPFFADAARRDAFVALAVRLRATHDRADGWILAAVPASALLGAFGAAVPMGDARMAVFRGDGVRLAGSNMNTPQPDEASMARRLATSAGMELRRFRDGSEHLVDLHGLPRYDISVVVSRDLSAVLTSWRQGVDLTATALALLLAVLAAAVHLVQQADRRRSEAQRALQAQVSRSGKLESLGRLAGGVAHDFNNLLAAILGYGEMAHDAAVPGSDQSRHLDRVVQAALRGKALVERILAISRGGARFSAVFELEPVVEEVLTLLSASLRPGVVLERVLEAPGARLRGDATQAFEAVMNLCTNGMQAMPDGGVLSVALQRAHVAEPEVLSHSALRSGDHVLLSVADEGAGITPAVMERLFEPFFTTRAAQSGTGLGLAVVHGVVAEFGGAIDVRSTPGRGARFTLYFPECTDAAGTTEPTASALPAGAGQTLIVVDDEPGLAALAEEMLRGLGYRPMCFTDPVAALQAFRHDPKGVAGVVTDEVMPAMTGTELAQSLKAGAPGLPVLLVSGYGGALLAHRAAAAGVTRVLGKPLRRLELARALAEILR